MSLDYFAYVGPVLVCEFKPQIKSSTKKITTCSNPECQNSNSNLGTVSKYCPLCGTVTVPKEITLTNNIPVNGYELISDTRLCQHLFNCDSKKECYIPNCKFEGNWHTDLEDNELKDLTNINIPEILKDFKIYFKNEIEILTQHCISHEIKFVFASGTY